MNISTIIAKALGIILLLIWLVFLQAGRVCVRQWLDMLSREPRENLTEKLNLWLEKASHQQKIAVSIIHKAIIRTWFAISSGQADNFANGILCSMYIIIIRWHVLPFIVCLGLILSGSLWLILLLPAAWILSLAPLALCYPILYPILMILIDIVSGWIYGGLIFSYFSSTSKLWYYASCCMGVVFMLAARAIINTILYAQEVVSKMKAIERITLESQ